MIGRSKNSIHPMQADGGRREAKYVLGSEALAAAIRESIQPFVHSDRHAADLPGRQYELVSLYLDSPALDLYLDTVRGEKNRYKLRIRRYFREGAPAFFEVKRRVNDVILKRRAAVVPEAVEPLLDGAPPRRSFLHKPSSQGLCNLLHFRDLAEATGASPRMRVRYVREPWVGRFDPRVRITFDRNLVSAATRSPDVLGLDATWIPSSRIPVILEIKFDDTMPEWVVRLVREFNLRRTSVPKYVLSVQSARQRGVAVAGGERDVRSPDVRSQDQTG